MRFIPVNFGPAQSPVGQADSRHTFELAPSSRPELPTQAVKVANAFANRDRFNLRYLPDYFKEHFVSPDTLYFKVLFKNFSPFTAISFLVGSILRQMAAARAMTLTSVVNDSITTSPL